MQKIEKSLYHPNHEAFLTPPKKFKKMTFCNFDGDTNFCRGGDPCWWVMFNISDLRMSLS
jgi:hypothetical protein